MSLEQLPVLMWDSLSLPYRLYNACRRVGLDLGDIFVTARREFIHEGSIPPFTRPKGRHKKSHSSSLPVAKFFSELLLLLLRVQKYLLHILPRECYDVFADGIALGCTTNNISPIGGGIFMHKFMDIFNI